MTDHHQTRSVTITRSSWFFISELSPNPTEMKYGSNSQGKRWLEFGDKSLGRPVSSNTPILNKELFLMAIFNKILEAIIHISIKQSLD